MKHHANITADYAFPSETFTVWAYYDDHGYLSECDVPLTTQDEAVSEVIELLQSNGDDVKAIRVERSNDETPRRDITEDILAKVIEKWFDTPHVDVSFPEILDEYGASDVAAQIADDVAGDALHVQQERAFLQ